MMCDMEKKKLAVIGNGYLAGILAQAWEKGLLESCRFVGVLGRNREKTEALARRLGCRACFALGELMEEGPDYVVEAASVEAVKSWRGGGALRRSGSSGAVHRRLCGRILL